MYKSKLPPIRADKIIPRNFGSIKHITGSKMLAASDSRAEDIIQGWCLDKTRSPQDCIIISEKIDGSNAGAYKTLTGEIYPITKSGYDARTLGATSKELRVLGLVWAMWVNDNYELLDRVLQPGERLVFENAIMTHTLKYDFNYSPVFLLAKYDAANVRLPHNRLQEVALAGNGAWRLPTTLWIGGALPLTEALHWNSLGFSESITEPEGVVYKYESKGKHETTIKFVSHPAVGLTAPLPTQPNGFHSKYLDLTKIEQAADALGLTELWSTTDGNKKE